MSSYIRLSLRPNFQQRQLPCDGKVGDLLLLSPLAEDEFDSAHSGLASLWVCIKGSWELDGLNAVWARVSFDGIATCEFPAEEPPQDRPNLSRG